MALGQELGCLAGVFTLYSFCKDSDVATRCFGMASMLDILDKSCLL